jgi:hypothetical protein
MMFGPLRRVEVRLWETRRVKREIFYPLALQKDSRILARRRMLRIWTHESGALQDNQ